MSRGGCGPAGATLARLPRRCITLAEGYPRPFLTAVQGTPQIGKTALAQDWAHWALACFGAMYVLWLPHRRPRPAPAQPAVRDEPTAAEIG